MKISKFVQKRVSPLCLVAAFAFASSAVAAPIIGGTTTVVLDEAVAGVVIGAGVTPSAIGTGSLSGLAFDFPITGGNLSEAVIPGSTIAHDGSGIAFTAGVAALFVGNFLIDTTSLIISGYALSLNPAIGAPIAAGSGVPLFSLSLNTSPGLPFIVSLTDAAAGVLNDTFGTDLFSGGLAIGTAGTAPQVSVSEPGTAALLGALMLGLFATRRRRSKVAA
jgi:MYXO-CTERM domain-containing protein